jgi:hypothetical protein
MKAAANAALARNAQIFNLHFSIFNFQFAIVGCNGGRRSVISNELKNENCKLKIAK